MESLIGQQLGDYILESELGRGSMGVVYRARHITHSKQFAIKVLLDALSADMSFVTRFTREAHIIAGLNHPNIVRVYDAGRHGQHLYFVMEYFAGITAGHMLKERGRLPYGQVIEIAAQAADALDYAHTAGRLVHRDIKPENLLVDRWFRVKMLDFGLARVEGLHSITRVGTVVGSLYYVGPEQLLNQKLDGRTDIYALGVSIYEMLTGLRPYRGQTLTEMSRAIMTAEATPPHEIEPSVPPELERIIAKAMARDLTERYSRAGELHADLRALQSALNANTSNQANYSAYSQNATHIPATPLTQSSQVMSPNHAQQPASETMATNGAPPQQVAQALAEHRTLRTILRPTTLEPVPPAIPPLHQAQHERHSESRPIFPSDQDRQDR